MSTVREGRKPGKWLATDRLLAVALTIYEGSVHHRCGQPQDVSLDELSSGFFEVREMVCQACAALDQYEAEQRDRGKRTPGTVVSVVNAATPEDMAQMSRLRARRGG